MKIFYINIMYRNFTVLVIYKCLFYNSLKCILYDLVRMLKNTFDKCWI